MEIVETYLLGILVACLVELHYIRIGIARIFKVIVQTILSEEHHGIDERTHILVAIIAIGVLALHLAYPSGSSAACRPALKELDAGIDVRTILVGAIDGHSRHVEHTVVPASEDIRIVPARVGVVVPVAGGITALELTDTDRNVHPEQTVVIDILVYILRLVNEYGTRTHVRAYESHVHHVETGFFKLFLRGIFTSLLLSGIEEVNKLFAEIAEVIDIGRCRGRHLCKCAHREERHSHG